MLYYCGFSAFFGEKGLHGTKCVSASSMSIASNISAISTISAYQGPAVATKFTSLDDFFLEGSDRVISAYLGWCSLFLLTGSDKIVQYGHSDPKGLSKQTICKSAPKYVVKMECAPKQTYLLTVDGNVYIWEGLDFVDKQPKLLENLKAKEIAVGVEFACAITMDKQVVLIDPASENPVIYKGDEDEPVDISSGQEHILIRTNSGRVYAYGKGSRGQLGTGEVTDQLKEAVLIEALDGVHIKEAVAGGWHSMALSETDDVYVWGWNNDGQLGLPKDNQRVKATPLLLDALKDTEIVSVGAGSRHSMCVTSEGKVLGFGWNRYGQTGLDPHSGQIVWEPREIPIPFEEKVASVQCKYWSTLLQTE